MGSIICFRSLYSVFLVKELVLSATNCNNITTAIEILLQAIITL